MTPHRRRTLFVSGALLLATAVTLPLVRIEPDLARMMPDRYSSAMTIPMIRIKIAAAVSYS